MANEAAPKVVPPIESRAAKVSIVNALSTLLAVGIQLLTVPICLHFWSREIYGSWLALFSAFMLLRGLDGGYTTFVGNKLNVLYHRDRQALHEHLASAVFGTVVISVLELALAGGTLIFHPLASALGMPAGHFGLESKLGLLLLMTSWVLTGSYLGIVHRLLIPAGLMYQGAWWAMAFQICQFGAIAMAAIFRLDMTQTAVLFACAQAVTYIASAIYVRRALPDFCPWLKGARRRVGLADLGHSSYLTVSNLIQQGATNGSVLLVSVLAGPAAVPVFTTVRTLTNLWTAVTTVLSAPLLPDVVRIHVKGEVQKLVSINRAYWVLVGTAVNLGALASYPLIPYLYDQWTAHSVALDRPLLCLLLGSVVMANSMALIALHLNGINSLQIVLSASVIRAVCALGGGALAFGRHGLGGLGLAILAGEIIASLATARYFVKHEVWEKGLRMSAWEFGPVVLSTGAALLFFAGNAFGWWQASQALVPSGVAVLAAFVWGWKGLEPELQLRLKLLPARLLAR